MGYDRRRYDHRGYDHRGYTLHRSHGKKTVTEAGRLEPSGIVILAVPHREYVEQG
ncbi:MAG: hypothetical protein IIC64_03505 [SAR324 cluster bacterium]|nr:hypothetical protein [SAR324 cluster bacterium]